MILRFLARRDSDDYGDQRAFLGQQDLATFGVIITFIISVFVCSIRLVIEIQETRLLLTNPYRFLHRRRDRQYLLHDTLLLISLVSESYPNCVYQMENLTKLLSFLHWSLQLHFLYLCKYVIHCRM